MPKKFKGENSKAVAAKARKAEAAAEEKAKKDKAIEDAYWQEDDKHIKKKLARKDEREKKRQADLEKKAELRELSKNEEEEDVPKPTPQKLTQFQVQRNVEKELEQQKRAKETDGPSHVEVPLMENLNRLEDDVVTASGIDAAVAALSTEDSPAGDRHPEKRMAAAFRAYEEKRLPQLKKENPNLRLSQLKQMLRKEWLKSPENPLNRS